MDIFTTLPVNICLLVFDNIDSSDDLLHLAQASPAVRRVYSSPELLPDILMKLLPGDLLRDALAILLFPTESEMKLSSTRREVVVDAHLRAWGAGFHALLQRYAPSCIDPPLTTQLIRLQTRIWRLIRDYLNKATSRHLPHSYRHLPRWAHQSFAGGHVLLQDCNLLDLTGVACFDISILQEGTRTYILRSFLQYEILCRVYLYLDDSQMDSPTRSNRSLFDSWDWRCLRKYQNDATPIAGPWALASVREYIKTLYDGMIAANIKRATFFDYEDEYSTPRAILWADVDVWPSNDVSRSCNVDIHGNWGKLEPLREEVLGCNWPWQMVTTSLLASAGFDLLLTILQNGQKDFGEFLCHLWRGLSTMPQRALPRRDVVHSYVPFSFDDNSEMPWWEPEDLLRHSRQRAWVFLSVNEYQSPPDTEYGQMFGRDLSNTANFAEQVTTTGDVQGMAMYEHSEYICHGHGAEIDHCLAEVAWLNLD